MIRFIPDRDMTTAEVEARKQAWFHEGAAGVRVMAPKQERSDPGVVVPMSVEMPTLERALEMAGERLKIDSNIVERAIKRIRGDG